MKIELRVICLRTICQANGQVGTRIQKLEPDLAHLPMAREKHAHIMNYLNYLNNKQTPH